MDQNNLALRKIPWNRIEDPFGALKFNFHCNSLTIANKIYLKFSILVQNPGRNRVKYVCFGKK